MDGQILKYSGTRGSVGILNSTPGTVFSNYPLTSTADDTPWQVISADQGNAQMPAATEVVQAGASTAQMLATMSVDGGATGTGAGAGCRMRTTVTPMTPTA